MGHANDFAAKQELRKNFGRESICFDRDTFCIINIIIGFFRRSHLSWILTGGTF